MPNQNLTIMFTDLTDFTKTMSGMSREQIDAFLSSHENVVRPIIVRWRGKVIKTVGDSFLAVFESPTDAVLAGVDIQKAMIQYNRTAKPDEKMEIRVSINVGEVMKKGRDIFGDAVNVASRLLSVSEKNEVYFTEAVYLAMNKKEVPTAEVGYRQFKGVPEKIKVYRVLMEKPDHPLLQAPQAEIPQEDLSDLSAPSKKRVSLPFIFVIVLFGFSVITSIISFVLHEKEERQKTSRLPIIRSLKAQLIHPETKKKLKQLPLKSEETLASRSPSILSQSAPEAAPLQEKRHEKRSVSKPDSSQYISPTFPAVQKTKSAGSSGFLSTQLDIFSSPPGAAVYISGNQEGVTPIQFPISVGAHLVTLVKLGYQKKSFWIVVLPGEKTVLKENLILKKK